MAELSILFSLIVAGVGILYAVLIVFLLFRIDHWAFKAYAEADAIREILLAKQAREMAAATETRERTPSEAVA